MYTGLTPLYVMINLSALQKIFQLSLIINYSIDNNTLIPYIENFSTINFLLIPKLLVFACPIEMVKSRYYNSNKK